MKKRVSLDVKIWLRRVNYDMTTAKAMLKTKRYIYAIFMCQQAVEKCFKALLVFRGKEVLPIHNLRRLADLCEVIREKGPEILVKYDFLSQFYINARYKEDIAKLGKGIDRKVVEQFISFSQGEIKWLRRKMR